MGGAIHGLTGSGTLKAAGSGGSHTSWLPLEVSLCVIAPEDGDTIQLLQSLNLDSRGDSLWHLGPSALTGVSSLSFTMLRLPDSWTEQLLISLAFWLQMTHLCPQLLIMYTNLFSPFLELHVWSIGPIPLDQCLSTLNHNPSVGVS